MVIFSMGMCGSERSVKGYVCVTDRPFGPRQLAGWCPPCGGLTKSVLQLPPSLGLERWTSLYRSFSLTNVRLFASSQPLSATATCTDWIIHSATNVTNFNDPTTFYKRTTVVYLEMVLLTK